MTDGIDAALAKEDQRMAVYNFFHDVIGAEAEQSEIASRSLVQHFTLVGTSLMFNGKSARDAVEDVQAFLKRQKYDFLLPSETPNLNRAAVDPALLDRAFAQGSPDARAEVFKRVGNDQTKLDALARDYGLRDARDYKTKGARPGKEPNADAGAKDSKNLNPFSAEGWNLTEQGRVLRRDPVLAASLAKSAGSHIGATKPGRAA